MEYMDDTALFCNLIDQLRDTLTTYRVESAKLDFQLSQTKTKLMYVSDGLNLPPLHIDPDVMEFVSCLIYLGFTITKNGSLTPEINC